MSTTDPCIQVGNTLDSRSLFDTYVSAAQTQLDATPTPSSATLQSLRTEINNRIACLQGKIRENTANPSKIGELQSSIISITAAMEADREALEISKARSTYIDEARRPVSYYESWFPIGRPMKPFMMIILMMSTLFLVVLGGILLIGVFGIRIIGERVPPTNPIIAWLMRLGPLFWTAFILVIVGFSLYFNK